LCVVGRQVRDGWAYDCAVPIGLMAYANRNPGLDRRIRASISVELFALLENSKSLQHVVHVSHVTTGARLSVVCRDVVQLIVQSVSVSSMTVTCLPVALYTLRVRASVPSRRQHVVTACLTSPTSSQTHHHDNRRYTRLTVHSPALHDFTTVRA